MESNAHSPPLSIKQNNGTHTQSSLSLGGSVWLLEGCASPHDQDSLITVTLDGDANGATVELL